MTRRTTGKSLPQGRRGAEAIPHGMAQLLRLLSDPAGTHKPGGVDPPKIAQVSLAREATRSCAEKALRSSLRGSLRADLDSRRFKKRSATTSSIFSVWEVRRREASPDPDLWHRADRDRQRSIWGRCRVDKRRARRQTEGSISCPAMTRGGPPPVRALGASRRSIMKRMQAFKLELALHRVIGYNHICCVSPWWRCRQGSDFRYWSASVTGGSTNLAPSESSWNRAIAHAGDSDKTRGTPVRVGPCLA